jgi:hypothetical protein
VPIYLVRWQDLSAALVRAADEDELVDILDELANPDGATWTEYDGPLWVEFEVPATWHTEPAPDDAPSPLRPEQIVVDDVHEVEPGELRAAVAPADTGSDMVESIFRWAFPKLHEALYGPDRVIGREDAEDRLREVVRAELLRQVQASWRIRGTQRADDPLSRVAAEMDTSRRWVEKRIQSARDTMEGSRPAPKQQHPATPKRRAARPARRPNPTKPRKPRKH